MQNEGIWRRDYHTALDRVGKKGRGGDGDSRHRAARMRRFAAKHASPSLLRKLLADERAHEKAVHAKREADRLAWGRATPGRGALRRVRIDA